VQGIIRELRGEKIDIVEWSDDPILFVTKALSPAKVQHVTIVDEEDRIMEVVVEDMQLSLAIGKKGQNVRLAAKLTGWRIDIKSEEDKRREVEEEFGTLEIEEGADAEGDATQGEPLSAIAGEDGAVTAGDAEPAEGIAEATTDANAEAASETVAEEATGVAAEATVDAVVEAEVGEK
jgi:N utilization substance protein A